MNSIIYKRCVKIAIILKREKTAGDGPVNTRVILTDGNLKSKFAFSKKSFSIGKDASLFLFPTVP